MTQKQLKFIMLSAMYENGGNTTHRFLDGHPELFVYPFESQPGTKYVNDFLSSMYPIKYRWPVFPNSASVVELYNLIIDEEAKIRSKTPYVSKFRDANIDMDDKERCANFVSFLKNKELNRKNIVESFYYSTFKSWKNYNKTGKERAYVGYSPIIGVDGDKIIKDLDGKGYIIHVVRNPFSAYADTKKRAVPLSIEHYMTGWILSQHFALLYKERYPKNFFVVRFEDIIINPEKVLGNILKQIDISESKTLSYTSWNGKKLDKVYPWGTIVTPTTEANILTAKELSKDEIKDIYERTKMYIDHLGYNDIYKSIK